MNEALDELLKEPTSEASYRQAAQTLGCSDLESGAQCLADLLSLGLATDLLSDCLRQLATLLPNSPNPDRGLQNLARYIRASRSPQALLALFERDSAALPTLMNILATSQSWSEQLITDPESFDLLRMTEGMPVSRGVLLDELSTEIMGQVDQQMIARSLYTLRQRETMRIAFGDFIGALPVELVAQQLTILAEAILEIAMSTARREAAARYGLPMTADGKTARMAVIGYESFGASELSYSPRLHLMFVCDAVQANLGSRTA